VVPLTEGWSLDSHPDYCGKINSLAYRDYVFSLIANKLYRKKMTHTKTFYITPTYFDHQMIIIRELSDPGQNHWLKCESSSVVMRQHNHTRIRKLPGDDHLMIETCWSDFKYFIV
jgi:hypothetical protein